MPASSARDFKNRRVHEVVLPSGLTAELRRPDVIALASRNDGSVPTIFVNQIKKGFNGQGKASKTDEFEMSDLQKMLDLMARASFISPSIASPDQTPDYDANQIALDDLDFNDKMFVFSWVMGQAVEQQAAIERFPVKPDSGLEPIPDVQNVADDTSQKFTD